MPLAIIIGITIDSIGEGGLVPPLMNMITETGAIEIISEAGVDIVTE
jgi:hypothetical protein